MNKQLKVAHVIDQYTIAINAGSECGIQPGQRYLLYTLSSEEIFDPDTHESLGYLEIVKGSGKVTNVQKKMSTIKSDEYRIPTKKISRKYSLIFEEIETGRELLPFKSPCEGDLLKRIN